MRNPGKNYQRKIFFLLALFAAQISIVSAQNVIKLNVDASEAARNVLHVKETMSVKGGRTTLFYPKWIPGEHAPTGTLNDMVNFFVSAGGKPLAWTRDDVEMFAFHVDVPGDVKSIDITFDDVSQAGTIASANLSRIKWNRLLVYQLGVRSDDIQVAGSLKMPDGWKYATALTALKETTNAVDFKPVNLTMFIDSPAVVGRYFKRVPLIDANGAAHEIDLFADTAEALEYKPETLQGWKNLITQANLAFGARHYNDYKFLVTLSDVGGSEGLEHHQSSEDGVGEKALSDSFRLLDLSDLLGHEYAHSWNGKYRRPAGLATPDFDKPMQGELLWVYEGLTQYLGHVLPTRAGLWTPEYFREVAASDAANLDNQTGRRWRPLVDTARAVQFTYGSPRAWRNQRRSVDYYDEGALIWLEADVLIRQKSGGKSSLDDFFKKFHGGQNTAPQVVPYTFDEVVATLNSVLPFDWRGFFNERVYNVRPRAPLGGIENGGWRLIYNDVPNLYVKGVEDTYETLNLMYSIGASINKDGTISDINPDLPAAKSGLAPGFKITKVGAEDFSIDNMRKAITAKGAAIEITAENGNQTQAYRINYSGGTRYPHLERAAGKADTLSEIVNQRSFLFQVTSSVRQGKRKPAAVNMFPDVTNLILNQTEIIAACSTNSNACSGDNRSIEVSTEAIDPENDVLLYDYVVSGGKIVGQGAKVVWDLSKVKPGTYTITAAVEDGCGVCGKTITKEVKVAACADCSVN